jgi:hypothetical protein
MDMDMLHGQRHAAWSRSRNEVSGKVPSSGSDIGDLYLFINYLNKNINLLM